MQGIPSGVRRNALPLLVLVFVWVLLVPAAESGNVTLNRAAQVGLVLLAGLVVALMFPARWRMRLLGGAIGGIVGEVMVWTVLAVVLPLRAGGVVAGGESGPFGIEWLYWFVALSPLAALVGLIGGAIAAWADSRRATASN